MKNNTISKILGILFVIWFIASLVAILLNTDNNTNIVLILIGQYFLVFGIVGIYSAKAPMISLHYFVGLALITAGLIGSNTNKLSILITDLSLSQKMFILIIVITLISIVITLILYIKEKKTNKMIYPFLLSNVIYIIELIILTRY